MMLYGNRLVSVIVPVYKVEAYINVCVDSIIKQTYKNLEIILVDDGSPDRCPYICDEYAEEDNRIRVIHKKNGGLSDARNVGTAAATGNYITYVDSDDIIHEEYVEYLVQLICKYNANISICKILDCTETIKPEDSKKGKGESVFNGLQAIEKMMYQTDFTNSASGKLYSMAFASLLQFPVGKYHEDLMTIYKPLFAASKIAYGQRELYYYIHRQGSISHSDTFSNNYFDLLEAIDEVEHFAEEKCQDILPSVYSRKFSCYSQILEVVSHNHPDIEVMLWEWIKQHRMSIVKNPKVRRKNRIAAFLTFMGKKNYLKLYKYIGKRKV